MKPTLQNIPGFGKNYNATKLFDKIGEVASKAGIKVVYAALLLYYALMDGEVPLKDKAIVIGALGYFICPLDFIPDLLGPIGYTDDGAAMVLALKTIWDNITPTTHMNARKRLESWFGSVSDSDLKLL